MNRNDIFTAIEAERAYQDSKWANTDDQNSPYHWTSYISHYASRNLVGAPNGYDLDKYKKDLVKVAALATAALETL